MSMPRFKFIFTTALRIVGAGVTELHGQSNALAGHIYLSHFDFDDVARLHHFSGICNEFVAQLTHVNQAILVNAQIDEGAKRSHVADGPFQNHAFF